MKLRSLKSLLPYLSILRDWLAIVSLVFFGVNVWRGYRLPISQINGILGVLSPF